MLIFCETVSKCFLLVGMGFRADRPCLLKGLATIDKSLRYAAAYPQVVQKLNQAMEGAKRDRLGIFE